MKTRILPAIIGIIVLAITLGVFSFQSIYAAGPKKDPIDFSLKDTTGKTVKLADYRGKVVVVDVWTTWCGFCVREIPDLVALQEEMTKQKKPVQLLGISMDDEKETVTNFLAKHPINYPILYGEEKGMRPLGSIMGYPTKFIIDKHGVIVDQIIGAIPKAELTKRILKYVKK